MNFRGREARGLWVIFTIRVIPVLCLIVLGGFLFEVRPKIVRVLLLQITVNIIIQGQEQLIFLLCFSYYLSQAPPIFLFIFLQISEYNSSH